MEEEEGALPVASAFEGQLIDNGQMIGVTVVTANGSRCHFALTPDGGAKLMAFLGGLAGRAVREGAAEWQVVTGD
ncbi:MAG: hypothetical protein U1E56_01455 [Bauldia sp.]